MNEQDKTPAEPITLPEYVTLEDAAKAFGLEPVSRQAMVNWTREGVKSRDGKRNVVLKSRLMSREVKTTLEWFHEWIEERSKPTEGNETCE